MAQRKISLPVALLLMVMGVGVAAWSAGVLPPLGGAPPPPLVDAQARYNDLVLRAAPHDGADAVRDRAVAAVEEAAHDLLRTEFSRRVGSGVTVRDVASSLLHGAWDDPRHDEARAFFNAQRERVSAVIDALVVGTPTLLIDDATLQSPATARTPIADWVSDADRVKKNLAVTGVRFAGVRFREQLETGDSEGAIRTLRSMLHAAHRPPATLSALDTLGLAAIVTEPLAQVRYAALEGMDAALSEALIEVVRSEAKAPIDAILLCIEGERLAKHEEAWRLRHAVGGAEYQARIMVMADHEVGSPRAIRRGSDESIRDEIDAFFDSWTAVITGGPSSPAAFPDLAAYPRIAPWVASEHRFLGYATSQVTLLRTEQAATIATLRLAAHRDRHDAWPDSLARAMPAEETFDPLTGEAFGYEQVELEDAGVDVRIIAPDRVREFVYIPVAGEDRRTRAFERFGERLYARRPDLRQRIFPWLPDDGSIP